MSKLDELIQQLCPDGVEYKLLGEVCNSISDGSHNPPKGVGESSYIMISSQNIQPNGLSFDNVRYLTTEDFEKENKRTNVSFGDVLLTIVGTIGRSYVVKENDPKLTLQRSVAILHPSKKINSYFLHYYLLEINSVLNRLANGAAQKGIYLNQLSDIAIPLPPLPVQEEIVRLLDQLTETTQKYQVELEAELDARKKQYEEYRNQLLDFEGKEGVEMKTLGDMCVLGTGSHNTQDGLSEGQYPFYTRGSEILYLNNFDYDETAIITAGDGAGVGKVFHYVQGKYALHQRAYRIVPDEKKVLTRFVYYYIGATFYNYIMRNSVSSSVVSIRRPMMVNYPIPHPPLAEQERIVNILDRMDKTHKELCKSIETEIKMRKQQYEYYRNQLLDFNKKEDCV